MESGWEWVRVCERERERGWEWKATPFFPVPPTGVHAYLELGLQLSDYVAVAGLGNAEEVRLPGAATQSGPPGVGSRRPCGKFRSAAPDFGRAPCR